ncbi:MAG TPA: cyclic nucleotide-binding domain-containing protein, partial [Candidatus Dormibacteraeota bacterium]
MSRRGDLQSGLGAIPLFSACSKRDLGIVARHMEVLSIPAETALCTEGELGDGFFVILEGRASVSRQGRRVTTLGVGGWF